MEDAINIKELCNYFSSSAYDIYKKILKVSNTYGIKMLHQNEDNEIYIHIDYFNKITDYINKYKNIIPLRDEILSNAGEFIPFKQGSYVYFLLNNREIVYIGQTINLGLRLYEHNKDKIFNYVYYMRVLDEERLLIESLCIQEYKPNINIEHIEGEIILNYVLSKIF